MENIENVTGDVLDLNNQFASYQDYKAAVDTEMNRAAESFVRIGYLLKIARDTDILKESEYANVNEFAESIYHLDKSQVSRFININDGLYWISKTLYCKVKVTDNYGWSNHSGI